MYMNPNKLFERIIKMEKKLTKINGSLKISKDVILKIAELAASEITGVAVNGTKLVTGAPDSLFAYRFGNPIKVTFSGEAAEIDVNIVVVQGYKAVNVAESVQASVKSAVQNMTGIVVSKVNIRIAGIKINTETQ